MQLSKSKFVKVLSAILLFSLIVPPSTVTANSIPDEQYSTNNLISASGAELQGLLIQDDLESSNMPSSLTAVMDQARTPEKLRICKSFQDEFCSKALSINLVADLPPCSEKITKNCIESLSAENGIYDNSPQSYVGVPQGNFPSVGRNDFEAVDSVDLPNGSTPSIWKLPGLNHGGGTDEYLVKFNLRGESQGGQKFVFGSYVASINPFTRKSGSFGRKYMTDSRDYANVDCAKLNLPCGTAVRFNSMDDFSACAAVDDGSCALKQAFPNDTRFKLVVRLTQSPTGWFHGRVKSPNIKLEEVGDYTKVTIDAEPVSVPLVGVSAPYSSLPENLKTYYSTPHSPGGGSSWGEPGPTGRRNVLAVPSPDSIYAFEALQNWSDFIKDKASASPTLWKVRSLSNSGSASRCFSSNSKFIGFVSTNSMVYLGEPPIFNNETQSLDYKVASPHLNSKGEVFKGTYDLIMASEVARCLYGFSSAPVRASIQIVNSDGQNSVATTVVSEKDGWLKLGAYGFTFSSPTLRVKLTQDKASAKKKSTISCIKGKTTKKVSGVAPKCPSGYKKK